jgi:hypothetical protein
MAVMLGRSPARRRGSSGRKPVRRTAGRWGSVCGARAWTGETNGAQGRKIRPAAGGSILRGGMGQRRGGAPSSGDATRRGARGAWLRLASGVLTVALPRRARAAHLCFGSGAPTRLTRGTQLSAGEGVRRERHGHT